MGASVPFLRRSHHGASAQSRGNRFGVQTPSRKSTYLKTIIALLILVKGSLLLAWPWPPAGKGRGGGADYALVSMKYITTARQ
jgi:hypothetical protein